ncbi:MAG: PadR family transcriptional regulator [Thermomicrobiales bacterium]
MPSSAIDSQLVLHILGLLVERPMHQYALRRTLAERYPAHRAHTSAGSIYALVASLTGEGWIEAVRTEREGKRLRTIYGITGAGWVIFRHRIDTQIRAAPSGMSPFADAIAYLGALAPDEAIATLRARLAMLHQQQTDLARALQEANRQGVSDLHMIEADFLRSQLEGETRWIECLIDRIASGDLLWPESDVQEDAP